MSIPWRHTQVSCCFSVDRNKAFSLKFIQSVTLFIGVMVLAGCKNQTSYVTPAAPVVKVAHPMQCDLPVYLQATGMTKAHQIVDLVARVGGTLNSIDYRDGQSVKKGDTLFQIDPVPYQVQVHQAESDVQKARAILNNAQDEYQRQASLVARHAISQSSFDTARQNRDTAKAGLLSAQSSLELAQINLSYTRITAPFAGEVTAHRFDVGSVLSSGGTSELATMVQVSPLNVEFSLSEKDWYQLQRVVSAKFADGQVNIDARTFNESGYPHHGVIDYFSPQLDAESGTLALRAIFPNQDHTLLPGMFVHLRIRLGIQTDVLLIPDKAIGTDQAGRYVFVVDKNHKVKKKSVTVTAEPDGYQRVIHGLTVADSVIVGGFENAMDGMTVTSTQSHLPPVEQTPSENHSATAEISSSSNF